MKYFPKKKTIISEVSGSKVQVREYPFLISYFIELKIEVMNYFFKAVAVSFFLALYVDANSQVKVKIFSESIPSEMIPAKGLISKNMVVTPPVGFEKLKREAESNDKAGGVNRFALSSEVDIDLLSQSAFSESNGLLIYFLTIKSPAALTLSIQFNKFQLSENSLLSIYTKNELTDSITSKLAPIPI
jgi:hypothetical protein